MYACLLACLLDRLLACLLARSLACLLACSLARLLACLLACLCACFALVTRAWLMRFRVHLRVSFVRASTLGTSKNNLLEPFEPQLPWPQGRGRDIKIKGWALQDFQTWASWAHLGASWAHLGASSSLLGASRGLLGILGASRGLLCASRGLL